MSDEECPMSKRMRLDAEVDDINLAHFDVIDEVQGDGTASEGGKCTQMGFIHKVLTFLSRRILPFTTCRFR